MLLAAVCLTACGEGGGPAPAADRSGDAVLGAEQSADHGAGASGQETYARFCASCHDTGVMGAPVTGSPGDWDGRSQLWQAVLTEHAKAGYLEMPARGGESVLDDLAVSQAVEYMMLVTYPDKLPD